MFASTNGVDRSTYLAPALVEARKRRLAYARLPGRTLRSPRYPSDSRPLIHSSSTVGASRCRCNGPHPATASNTNRAAVEQPADGAAASDRVQGTTAHELAHLGLDRRQPAPQPSPLRRCRRDATGGL